MAEASNAMEDMMARLRREFVDTADDRLGTLDELVDEIRQKKPDSPERMSEFRRIAHSLKGMGGTFGYPLISVIAHRLEDYIETEDDLHTDIIEDVQIFLDRMRDVIEGTLGADDPNTADIVRALPIKRAGFDVDNIQALDVEVMTVMPKGMATTIVEKELRACGYRVSNVEDPIQALEYAVRTKPDMVMASGVLPGLTGVDLACAFRAMPVTRNIPVVLFTSFGRDHKSLVGLPKEVPIVKKGGSFSEDLANALFDTGLT
jgi:CheY-like chemotaxis protein/HPt (histidine-containing phosphotransfer) domain-containing protein